MNRREKLFSGIQTMTVAAMLTAMSVVIGIFCKNFMNFGGGLFRVTFENFPILLSGILFGPAVGATVGAATDLVSYFMSSQALPPNLIVTVGAASVGLVSGLMSRFVVRKRGYAQFIISGIAAHAIGSMIIKPIGLFTFYGWAVLWRIPLYLVIAPLEILLICLLYKNLTFRKLLDRL